MVAAFLTQDGELGESGSCMASVLENQALKT